MHFAWIAVLVTAGCFDHEYAGGFADFDYVEAFALPETIEVTAIPEGDGLDWTPPCPILSAHVTVDGIEVPMTKRGGEPAAGSLCIEATFVLSEGVPQVAGAQLRLSDEDATIECDLQDALVPRAVMRLGQDASWVFRAGESFDVELANTPNVSSVSLRDATGSVQELAIGSFGHMPDTIAPGDYELLVRGPLTNRSCATSLTLYSSPMAIQAITVVP